MSARFPHPRRRERGVVMILVALSAAVLIGFIGLVVDLGRLFVIKTELQSAMDACALAAAQELRPSVTPPDSLALIRAVNAGVAAGNRNMVDFQSASVGLSASDIMFSDHLSDYTSVFPFGYVSSAAANPATAAYAMCSHTESGIAAWFMQLLGIGASSVKAWAVATLAPAQSNCGVPLGVCEKGAGPGFGLTPGSWVSGTFSSGQTGNFNWIDFSPPNGGASELSALLTGQGQCNLTVKNQVGQNGADQSVVNAWNTRFGIYQSGGGGSGGGGGGGNQSMSSAPPDYTGYGYTSSNWPSMSGAFSNFQSKRAANASYQGGIKLNGSTVATSSQLATYGSDRRLVTAPIINCNGWASAQTVPIDGWACVLMLNPVASKTDTAYLEIVGLASAAGSPCVTSGLAGGSNGPQVAVLVQ